MGAQDLSRRLGRILIVGGGKMGQAMLAGMLAAGAADPSDIVVANPGQFKRDLIEREYGVRCVADAKEAPEADTCVLAVKPQILREVLSGLAACEGFAPKRVVSIAAGIKISDISCAVGQAVVVRAMPNTPLVVGRGVVGFSMSPGAPADEALLARELFGCMGSAVEVPEVLQDAVVAVSGSGPAYFALFVRELARAGEGLGLDPELSLELALQTMIGTAKLLDETGQSPDDLIEAVSSPGGTTVAALDAFEAGGLAGIVSLAARAAHDRSEELSR